MTFNPAPNPAPPRTLRRCPHGRMLGGVAAGAADYLDVDPLAARIALVIFALVGGLAIPLYAAAWVLIPEEGSDTSIAEHLLHHDVRL
ncbi:MAG: PspC domain-containing protein [Actinomycetota bacterium]|nr:PspC domain-containing protein [Actinomycetota bacterium]